MIPGYFRLMRLFAVSNANSEFQRSHQQAILLSPFPPEVVKLCEISKSVCALMRCGSSVVGRRTRATNRICYRAAHKHKPHLLSKPSPCNLNFRLCNFPTSNPICTKSEPCSCGANVRDPEIVYLLCKSSMFIPLVPSMPLKCFH